jgi:hypothetical protein
MFFKNAFEINNLISLRTLIVSYDHFDDFFLGTLKLTHLCKLSVVINYERVSWILWILNIIFKYLFQQKYAKFRRLALYLLGRNCPKLLKIETLGYFDFTPMLLFKKKNGLFRFVLSSQSHMAVDQLDNDNLASWSE